MSNRIDFDPFKEYTQAKAKEFDKMIFSELKSMELKTLKTSQESKQFLK